ncbi:hypothetical protein MMC10_010685 [Thelotrema lepadinum]|nr:hypothetical protein [Thelotrema lepadinum]
MSGEGQKTRPRSRSVLSFGSNKSSDSKPKFTKAELQEAAKEKTHKRMSTKANPNIAVDELEPAAQALEKSTVQSNLRAMTFHDQHGNPITDPDRSNPTRPRLERPLDTIRSFEAAIDGSYDRRLSRIAGANGNLGQGIPGQNGNYGNRMAPSRPVSYVDPYGYGNPRQSPMPFGRQRRSNHVPRNNSDPIMYGNNNSNGMHVEQRRDNYHYQNPYETSTQGSGSGGSNGTEPWSVSTDPSSEASSIERFQQQQQQQNYPVKPDLGEQYGFNGFGEAPNGLEYAHNDPTAYGIAGNGLDRRPQMRQNDIPPPPPPHLSNSAPRQPIKANTLRKQISPIHEGVQSPVKRSSTGEKRKSWLMRRFSKGG